MTSEVFWCGADGDATLENLQSNIGPFANGLQIDATVDEGLRQVATTRPKGVGPYCNGTRYLVSLEELDGLANER